MPVTMLKLANAPCNVVQGNYMYYLVLHCEYDLKSDLDLLYDFDLKYWSTCYGEWTLQVPWQCEVV